MRALFWTMLSLVFCGWLTVARADTYQLNDGGSVSGDIILFNEVGITLRTPGDNYTNVVWPKFSQDALKQLAQNPKIKPLAGPFIEKPPRIKETHVSVKPVSRLALPAKESLFAALLSSPVGFITLLLIYAGNVYAGYEIANLRARPLPLVMGVAAVAPIIGPVIFLSMRMYTPPTTVEEQQPVEAQSFSVPGVVAPAAEGSGATRIHIAAAGATAEAAHPATQVFQRGQFMFNRRFFETKFSGFFAVVRRAAEKDLVLVIKTPKVQLVTQRITRIASNEAHFEVMQGGAAKEVMVPFADIQEIQIKHKDA